MSTPSPSELLAGGTLAGAWTVDPRASSVRLKTRAMWGLAPVKGFFREISGNGAVSPTGEVTGNLRVAAASIDTKSARRDQHLRSADFFESDSYPAIVFDVQGLEPSDTGATVTGTLTVRDRSQPMSFEAAVSVPSEGELWLDAEVAIDRQAFGLTWKGMGASMLNTLTIHAVLTRG